jgi:hypothetical protein
LPPAFSSQNDNYYILWKEEMENIFLLHRSYNVVIGRTAQAAAAAEALDKEAC